MHVHEHPDIYKYAKSGITTILQADPLPPQNPIMKLFKHNEEWEELYNEYSPLPFC